MDNQDWQTVTMKKRGSSNKSTDSRPPVSAHTALMRKLDHDEPVRIKSLSAASRQQIIQTRTANSWTQVQLNNACCFPAHTIRDIENGKAQPSPTQLNSLNRLLKLALKYE